MRVKAMRKVEIEMLKAIHEGRDWQSGSTVVEVSQHIGNPWCYATVYLHGNQIAEVYQTGATGEALIVAAELKTWRSWPIATTASRLRALGIDCKTGNSPWCDDGIHELRKAPPMPDILLSVGVTSISHQRKG